MYLNIRHVVGIFFDWPDKFCSEWLRDSRNVSGKLSMKLARYEISETLTLTGKTCPAWTGLTRKNLVKTNRIVTETNLGKNALVVDILIKVIMMILMMIII